ncbi:MAG: DUF1592 domain-containing protein [Polyangiaceae bacterium]
MRGLTKLGVLSLGLAAFLQPACSKEDEAPSHSGAERLQCDGVNTVSAESRLLTRVQYDNTVRDLLGLDLRLAQDVFPLENTANGFSNNARAHQASPLGVEKYMEAAEALSAELTLDELGAFVPCELIAADESCATDFIAQFGKRAFRRPLTDSEAKELLKVFQNASPKYGSEEAIRLVFQALLQSPQFLYRPESISVATAETGAVQLGSYEMASRLSYFLWNTTPDDELFQAADQDELRTADQIEAQARRMLEDPRAREVALDFNRQWLGLDRLDSVVREETPGVNTGVSFNSMQLPASWRGSLERFLGEVVFDGEGTVHDLFTSPVVYVDAELAKLYGVEAPAEGFVRVELDPKERAGLLTQPALLAMFSHPDQSAPIKRGVFVREQILCQPIDPPPPTVDQTPPDPNPNLTTRERFADHTSIPGCIDCHKKIDGIGFGLENYDQLGRFRADEFGIPIDASGQVLEATEERLNGRFNGAVQLSKRLADSAQVEDCIATQWYRYATGRVENDADGCSLQQVHDAFQASGGKLKELLVAITLSDAFRYRRPGSQDGAL